MLDMCHVWGIGEIHTEQWWGKPEETALLENLDVEGNVKMEIQETKCGR